MRKRIWIPLVALTLLVFPPSAYLHFLNGKHEREMQDPRYPFLSLIEENTRILETGKIPPDLQELTGSPTDELTDILKTVYLLQNAGAYATLGSWDCARTDFYHSMGISAEHTANSTLGRELGLRFIHHGRIEEGFAMYEQLIEGAPKNPLPRLSLAFFLATCQDDRIRDGDKAVEYAKKGCDLAKREFLREAWDVLAAAYAEKGDFAQAVIALQTALSHPLIGRQVDPLGQPTALSDVRIKERMQQYEGKKPLRKRWFPGQ